ncbi:MAG: glycosyltransferase family 2 protein [Anaerolineae bacterium]|jgi:dolichol-phosphate mannosyltransferase|nr:glycosyltransferase family 2 protein [Anaerolineae bacterium]
MSAFPVRQLISIICPAYNEQDNVKLFYDRMTKVADGLATRYDFEIIYMDNCSTDETRERVLELAKRDKRVKLLSLSRNFGYQASILCGMTHARGDASIVIDCDCEDPPELVSVFVAHWDMGHDVVYGIRNRRIEPAWIQRMRGWFYWLLQKTADNDIVMHMAEFALVTREVRGHMLDNKNTFPFLRTEIGYVGFKRIGVPYTRQARVHGKTHYSLWRMTVFALGGILSSSTFLLRVAAYALGVILPLNLLLTVLFLFDLWPKALGVLIALDLTYLVALVGVIGVYVARIYKNGVNRPVYIVDWKRSHFPEVGGGLL